MEAWIGSAVVAVVISSLVTIAGWYATHRSERMLEAARRQERIQDIQTALLADIRSTNHRFQEVDLDTHLEQVTALIEKSDGFTPFVPGEPGSLLWTSIVPEVHILPNEVIDPVVLFFSQLESIRQFVEDLRSERFEHLESSRKVLMFQDYVRMMKYLVQLGNDAERTLSRSLEAAALASSSAGDRSSQSEASAPASESHSRMASPSSSRASNIGSGKPKSK
jgi:hypothetical protein